MSGRISRPTNGCPLAAREGPGPCPRLQRRRRRPCCLPWQGLASHNKVDGEGGQGKPKAVGEHLAQGLDSWVAGGRLAKVRWGSGEHLTDLCNLPPPLHFQSLLYFVGGTAFVLREILPPPPNILSLPSPGREAPARVDDAAEEASVQGHHDVPRGAPHEPLREGGGAVLRNPPSGGVSGGTTMNRGIFRTLKQKISPPPHGPAAASVTYPEVVVAGHYENEPTEWLGVPFDECHVKKM